MSQQDYILSLNCVLSILLLFMFLEYLFVLIVQGRKAIVGGTKTKEDLKGAQEITEEAKQSDQRWRRIVQNHTETVAFAFIMFLISVYVCGYSGNRGAREALIVLIILYVFFRFWWTIAYTFALQPLRTIFWMMSMVCAVGGGFVGIIAAFSGVENGQLDSD